MARSLIDPSNLGEWIDAMRLDFSSPSDFVYSLVGWVSGAPPGVLVTGAAIAVAAMALTRKPGPAALIVIAALGVLGVVGWAL
ncbi:MAG: hypothetical protein L0210_08225 [Rhodospirillales bacterium]|nr:hypothetical protein [Rhodospirillales bacterium]